MRFPLPGPFIHITLFLILYSDNKYFTFHSKTASLSTMLIGSLPLPSLNHQGRQKAATKITFSSRVHWPYVAWGKKKIEKEQKHNRKKTNQRPYVFPTTINQENQPKHNYSAWTNPFLQPQHFFFFRYIFFSF